MIRTLGIGSQDRLSHGADCVRVTGTPAHCRCLKNSKIIGQGLIESLKLRVIMNVVVALPRFNSSNQSTNSSLDSWGSQRHTFVGGSAYQILAIATNELPRVSAYHVHWRRKGGKRLNMSFVSSVRVPHVIWKTSYFPSSELAGHVLHQKNVFQTSHSEEQSGEPLRCVYPQLVFKTYDFAECLPMGSSSNLKIQQ